MDLKCFLFSFKGRISRSQYWKFFISYLALFVLIKVGTNASYSEGKDIANVMGLILLWPSLAVQAKRWHDRDKSAWWILINIIPFIGFLWGLIENGFLVGTEGENSYGEDPLSNEEKT